MKKTKKKAGSRKAPAREIISVVDVLVNWTDAPTQLFTGIQRASDKRVLLITTPDDVTIYSGFAPEWLTTRQLKKDYAAKVVEHYALPDEWFENEDISYNRRHTRNG